MFAGLGGCWVANTDDRRLSLTIGSTCDFFLELSRTRDALH